MQSRNHRGIYLIVYKNAHRLGSRGEAYGFLIQMRLEKTQFMKRAICRVEKFAVVFFYAEDCDIHRSISEIGLAITTKLKLGRLRIDADFLIRGLPIRRAKTNTFSNRRGDLDEKQTEEQKGSFDSQRESSWE
jgi:hypothetical protein